MSADACLKLDETLLLGKGNHKACYVDSRDKCHCIKVAFSYPDLDVKREMKFRRCRNWRGAESRLMPAFYGAVNTDKGQGYVYERIMDYDGRTSLGLDKWLAAERERRKSMEGRSLDLELLLRTFRDTWLAECIIVTNADLYNVMVQQKSERLDDVQFRIVDNIGTHVTLPLLFFWDYLGRQAVARYWHRMLHDRIHAQFPDLVDEDMVKRLDL